MSDIIRAVPERDNAAWIGDLQAGGAQREAALADLHDRLVATLPYGLSRWLTPNDPQFDALIEDVTQDALMRALEMLATFEGRSQFTTWVYKIAVRLALTELRRRRWKDVSLEELTEERAGAPATPSWMAAPEAGPEGRAERSQAMEMIRRMMQEELSPRQRQALTAIAVNGVPMDEVARRMQTNRNALYKLLHDARLKLKKRMDKEGLSIGEMLQMFEAE